MLAEHELLRVCARKTIANSDFDELHSLLRQKIDWDYFLQKSKAEGACCVVYKAFLSMPEIKEKIPEDILQQLKTIYYSVVKTNVLISGTFEKIVSEFERENIRPIFLKGIVLAESVYNDIGSRSMTDIDILIKSSEFEGADKIIKNMNYQPSGGINGFPAAALSLYRNSIIYNNFNAFPRHIHVYWHIINLCPYDKNVLKKIDMNKIRRDSISVPIGAVSVRTFSIEHQILYLCMHALNHSFAPLILICDINELIMSREGRIGWNSLLEDAFKFGLAKYLYYGLYVAREILGTQVPGNVITRLKPKKISVFENKFISEVIEREKNTIPQSLVYLGMNEKWRDRFYFALAALLPSKNEMALIRQKDPSEISLADYLCRINSALYKFTGLPFCKKVNKKSFL